MSEYYQEGDCIECLKAMIKCRKKNKGVIINNERLGKIGREFKCDMDASSEITKVLANRSDKRVLSSNINLGDLLKGKSISIFIEGSGALSVSVSKGSHTHNAIYFETNDYTFASIVYKFLHIPSINSTKTQITQAKQED